jgi:hypothetical protein
VRRVGEVEVIAHIAMGLPLVDTRLTADRLDEFDTRVDTILFGNGSQCAATPDAIRTLLAAGHPAESLLYYRGGIHD